MQNNSAVGKKHRFQWNRRWVPDSVNFKNIWFCTIKSSVPAEPTVGSRRLQLQQSLVLYHKVIGSSGTHGGFQTASTSPIFGFVPRNPWELLGRAPARQRTPKKLNPFLSGATEIMRSSYGPQRSDSVIPRLEKMPSGIQPLCQVTGQGSGCTPQPQNSVASESTHWGAVRGGTSNGPESRPRDSHVIRYNRCLTRDSVYFAVPKVP